MANIPKPPSRPAHMAPDPVEFSLLAEEMVKLRAKGRTWAQIQMETGIPAAQAAVMANDYLNGSYESTSIEQARQLQIRRLEMLMGYLWEQVEAGDVLTQGRNTTNLITTIQQVTELLDLRKDRTQDQQAWLTEQQTALISHIVDTVRTQVMGDILALMTSLSQYDPESGKRSIPDLTALRAAVEKQWGSWFAAAAEAALDAVAPDTQSAAGSGHTASTGPAAAFTAQTPSRTIRGELGR